MGELVYNALGGTPAEPCPTSVSRWFDRGYCSRGDVDMWRAAATNLYALGVLPLLAQLEAIDPERTADFRPQAVDYQTRYNALPPASVLSTARNLEAVSAAVALMATGDALVDNLRAAIEAGGATPMALAIPGPPAQPREKSALARFAWPGVIVGSVVLVVGLSAWAAATGGTRDSSGNGKGRNGNGRRR